MKPVLRSAAALRPARCSPARPARSARAARPARVASTLPAVRCGAACAAKTLQTVQLVANLKKFGIAADAQFAIPSLLLRTDGFVAAGKFLGNLRHRHPAQKAAQH